MENENKKELIIPKETVYTKIVNFIKNIFIKKDKQEEKNESSQEFETIRKIEEDISVKKQTKQEELVNPKVKVQSDTDYYKMIYKGMNEGKLFVEDLTPDEFLNVMKMQKLEYEIVTKKLKDSMDNFDGN